jgi:hypothetical protein
MGFSHGFFKLDAFTFDLKQGIGLLCLNLTSQVFLECAQLVE